MDVNGEPWFVAKDVLRALDYADDYNPSRVMQAIPGEWKGVHRMHTPGGQQVAEAFGKEHRHVLRDIRETIDKCSESFTAPNFGLSEYTDSTGRSLDGVESDIDN